MERKNPFYAKGQKPLPPDGERPLDVVLMRGGALESRHRVHAVVCDSSGKILHSWGDPAFNFFPRSSIKLIQAVSWVARGYDKKFSLGPAEMAIACGSHEAEPYHVEVVRRWLSLLSLTDQDLECGTHEPYHRASARALAAKGELPCQIHNNCSGKHCGFLTACVAEGWPLKGYTNYDHPAQSMVREMMGEFLSLRVEALNWGIDGCGIPTYALPLRSLALAMARCADARSLGSEIQSAVSVISGAVADRPELIGGSDSFSSKVVAETKGRVFAKVGAEGVYGVWIPADGIGVAVKCEDGATRGSEAALTAILNKLGHPVSFYSPFALRWTGEVVGQFICS